MNTDSALYGTGPLLTYCVVRRMYLMVKQWMSKPGVEGISFYCQYILYINEYILQIGYHYWRILLFQYGIKSLNESITFTLESSPLLMHLLVTGLHQLIPLPWLFIQHYFSLKSINLGWFGQFIFNMFLKLIYFDIVHDNKAFVVATKFSNEILKFR